MVAVQKFACCVLGIFLVRRKWFEFEFEFKALDSVVEPLCSDNKHSLQDNTKSHLNLVEMKAIRGLSKL